MIQTLPVTSTDSINLAAARGIRIASWNCSGAFREKVGRALALNADVYVIQEAEPPTGMPRFCQ